MQSKRSSAASKTIDALQWHSSVGQALELTSKMARSLYQPTPCHTNSESILISVNRFHNKFAIACPEFDNHGGCRSRS
jgi:hypothetical protein